MRILQVPSLYRSRDNTGGEKMCYTLSQKLTEGTHDIEIAFATGGGKSSLYDLRRDKFYQLKRVNNKYLRKLFFDYYNPFNSRKFRNILNEFCPDLVHFHNLYGLSYNLISVTKSMGIPSVVTVHDYWPVCYQSTMYHSGLSCDEPRFEERILHMLHRKINNRFLKGSYLVANSKHVRRILENYGQFKEVNQIYNGIDVPNLSTSYEKIILFVGRLEEYKGFQEIAPVLNNVVKETEWRVIVLGNGSLKKKLEKNFQKIEFLGFQEPNKFYNKATILVTPFLWSDPFPYVTLEAMSYGVNVVSSAKGGVVEQIENGVNGFLYSSESKESFEKIITDYIRGRIDYVTIGEKSIARAREFNWDRCISDYFALYQRLIR